MTYSLLRTFAHISQQGHAISVNSLLQTESHIEEISHIIESRTTKASTYRENG